jgi:SAM-dependent methyltransferase
LGGLKGAVALDVAAGTGLLSRFLARLDAHVVAVEPDGRMAELISRDDEGISVVLGAAESIPLAASTVDLVGVSSAWHWFDSDSAASEIARVLRPRGQLIVLWNGVNYGSAEWLKEVRRLRTEVVETRSPGRPRYSVDLPKGSPLAITDSRIINWTWPRSPSQFVSLLGTYSGPLTSDPTALSEFASRAEEVADAVSDHGLLQIPMACVVVRAEKH